MLVPQSGRVDDVINVSGHRIGTAEVEGALDSHPSVSEAAVVPVPHDIKGQGIYAFVSLMAVCSADFLERNLHPAVCYEVSIMTHRLLWSASFTFILPAVLYSSPFHVAAFQLHF